MRMTSLGAHAVKRDAPDAAVVRKDKS
jgi:hypothetical protein